MIKVILTSNVENLGKAGDIKEVKDGFARNWLFPKDLAREATEENRKAVEKLKRLYLARKEKELEKFKGLAEKISSCEVSISRPVHEEKKLFGAITASEIVAALAEKGININQKNVAFENPIKELGFYEVKIKLAPQIVANLKVWITPR